MAINNISAQYDDGLLPDITLLTQGYYHLGIRLNATLRFCLYSLSNSILLLPCWMLYYIVSVLFLFLVWCPCMAINVVSVQYNSGLLPDDIILFVDPMLLPSGNPFKCHEEVLYLQPMIPPKRFDIFPPDWGMLRRSRRVQIFFKQQQPNIV